MLKAFSKSSGVFLKIIFGFIIVALVVTIGFGIYFFFEINAKPSNDSQTVQFEILPGESFSEVAQDLEKEKIIRNTVVFRLRARMLDAEGRLQPGNFYLRRNMKVDEVLETITNARLIERRVTIPEGLRVEEIAQKYAELGWDKTKFIQLVKEGDYAAKDFPFLADKPSGASVEGFLFPDTYFIPASFDEDKIIRMMLKQFGTQYNQRLRDKAQAGLGVYKIVTMASMIEKEAKKADERPTIASVFYNRLNKKPPMPLQSDPTAAYARDSALYEQDPNQTKKITWWKAPTVKDLQINSPYNTYVVGGLPVGPICNPGISSLTAATEPETTQYYYFVATDDREGSHDFSVTLQEHEEKIKKYASR